MGFRIGILSILLWMSPVFAYLDRTNVFAIDAGLGSSLDPAGRVFGEMYRQEWSFRGSFNYGLSEHLSLALRGVTLAQKPKDEYVLKLEQGKAAGDLRPDLSGDPGYNQQDISFLVRYSFAVGEIYVPEVEMGIGYGKITLQGNDESKPFLSLGIGHEFFIRPNMALEILGDGHIFSYKVQPLLVEHPHNLFLLSATAGLRFYL